MSNPSQRRAMTHQRGALRLTLGIGIVVTVVVIAAGAIVAAAVWPQTNPRALHGYSVEVPAGWVTWSSAPTTSAEPSRPSDPSTPSSRSVPLVPATVLETYRVPTSSGDGSLVVGRSPYLPRTTVSQLLVARRYLHTGLPELEIRDVREIDIGGRPAALFELTAAGTGAEISPTGLGRPVTRGGQKQLPTRRAWVSVPGGPREGTLEILLHCPEAAWPQVEPEWNVVLESLRWGTES